MAIITTASLLEEEENTHTCMPRIQFHLKDLLLMMMMTTITMEMRCLLCLSMISETNPAVFMTPLTRTITESIRRRYLHVA